MSEVIAVPEGGFSHLSGGGFPFSKGVAALDGHVLTRVRFRREMPLADGLAFAAAFIAKCGRPAAAFAACELRAPKPRSPAEFGTFNARYTELLRANGFGSDTAFPVARSNMAPLFAPPPADALFAFTYAEPSDNGVAGRDFLISGQPELSEDPVGIVAPGHVSPAGMAMKARFVVDELKSRVTALGRAWADLTGAQAYTIQPLDGVMDTLRSSGLAAVGLSLFPGYPPVTGLDFEIDVRSVSVEMAI